MKLAEVKTSPSFVSGAQTRVAAFVAERGADVGNLVALTPDASAREYFRIPWHGSTAIVAAYPEGFDKLTQPFLDVTGLFQAAALPVPQIYAVDEAKGLIVQEDCGDRQLYDYFATASEADSEQLLKEAVTLIARIQQATVMATERESVASKLAFDFAKLSWELDFFYEHFFGSLRKEKLKPREAKRFKQELAIVARELAARPRVLCHRDYHASNLLVDGQKRLRIIDYQDARLGPASYDLVSLLLDRVTQVPSLARIRAGRLNFLQARVSLDLPVLEAEEFTAEFRLMTVQRVLKAIGTFSFQIGVRGRVAVYGRYINPMLMVAVQACELLERFPLIQSVLADRASDKYV